MSDQPTCETCKWLGGGDFCHAMPPTGIEIKYELSGLGDDGPFYHVTKHYWPQMNIDDFCGQRTPKE